jgi:hypothetical protein
LAITPFKEVHSYRRKVMMTRIVTLAFFCFILLAPLTAAAQDQSVGRTFGEAGRAIVEESRSAYETSRDLAVETGRAISEDAREAYEEGKRIGPKMAEDVKNGFQGGGQAPDPTKTAPAAEKP